MTVSTIIVIVLVDECSSQGHIQHILRTAATVYIDACFWSGQT